MQSAWRTAGGTPVADGCANDSADNSADGRADRQAIARADARGTAASVRYAVGLADGHLGKTAVRQAVGYADGQADSQQTARRTSGHTSTGPNGHLQHRDPKPPPSARHSGFYPGVKLTKSGCQRTSPLSGERPTSRTSDVLTTLGRYQHKSQENPIGSSSPTT